MPVLFILFVLFILLSFLLIGLFVHSKESLLGFFLPQPPFIVLQMEDRKQSELETLMSYTSKKTLEYGGQYFFLESFSELPPYWRKVFGLQFLMKKFPKTKLFMWVDSDAYLVNNPLKFIDDKEYSMWISPDAPRYSSPFCAGVFIVRNDKNGQQIIKEWTSYYKSEDWKFSDGKWSTNGVWAGETYEQGSFIKNLLPRSEELRIKKMPYHVFSEVNCREPNQETSAIHLAGSYKEFMQTCISTL